MTPVAEFRRTEHVIPKAFCSGFVGALTLAPPERAAVCDACNERFGSSMELALGRDTYEALLRLAYGAKRASDASQVGGPRLEVTIPVGEKWGGVRVRFSEVPGEQKPGIEPVPQARFALRTRGFVSYTEPELETLNPRDNTNVDPDRVSILWPGSDPGSRGRIIAVLERYGIRPRHWRHHTDLPKSGEPAPFGLQIRGVLDAVIARALTKIAFNYLVWVTHGGDPQVALRSDFDAVRAFVLEGEGRWQDFVAFPALPILAIDSERRRSTAGHLLTVQWKRFGGAMAQVSLFNDLTYRIQLAPHMRGVWRDVSSGHHYNPETGKVEVLGRTSLVLPPRLVLPH